MRTPVTIGVVGLGRRGPELARVLDALPQAELRWLCDHDPEAPLALRARYPKAQVTSDFDELLDDERLDAVALATPAVTRYALARRALEADKHVLVETPLALTGDHADDLVTRAERAGRHLMVGDSLLLDPGVRRLRKLIDAGRLGEPYYIHARHHRRSPAGRQANALWSLGPHDVSIVLHLLGDEPVEAVAWGGSYVEPGIPDVLSGYLRFATGIGAHLHLSVLDPDQVCSLTAVGSRRAATFDGLAGERKLRIHDPGGDIVSPLLGPAEPLRLECERFLADIRSQQEPAGTAREGAAVVRVLEALQRSLDRGGSPTPVGAEDDDTGKVVTLPRLALKSPSTR